jgi:aspartate racemase
MKTIGLIGGMSWESSAVYYHHINKQVNEQLGGVHSAKILMYSADYDPLVELQRSGNWEEIANISIDISKKLENAGADCILICCNTVHIVAEQLQENISIPLIHIADVTGEEIKKNKISKVALLGTKFTMEKDFFKGRLKQKFNIDTILPDEADKDFVHHSIYNEFCKGIFNESTKTEILKIIDKLISEGAEGVILGCTELPMLIKPSDLSIPSFDTTLIHSTSAVTFALS